MTTTAKGVTTLVRAGVRFDKVPRPVQSELDRFVFAAMARKARAKAAVPGAERRLAPRVEMGQRENLHAEILPDRPLGALSGRTADGAPPLYPGAPRQGREDRRARFKVFDISTTGCSFYCALTTCQRGQLMRLRLVGEGLDVELAAKVVHLLS